ncbi:MAG: FAD-binding oxidoreductase [Candidatus Kapabacteria bacterium]|nr:FAD-binding oxidoreductase [Candidatus Kapabacteria bacterium]
MNRYVHLVEEFKRLLPGITCSTAVIDRVAYSTDASLYKILPAGVATLATVSELNQTLTVCNRIGLPVTLRAAGSSLSGQAIGEGLILLLRSREFERITIMDNGNRVRAGASVRGAMVNAHLKQYKRKIGPDPASINTCYTAGIVSNNASGMCCGTEFNSYKTISSIEFILADGTLYSSTSTESRERFSIHHAELSAGLLQLRDSIRRNSDLRDKIRHKYRIKNTVGYALNSFLDYDDPIDIFSHLMIGSEGTLAAIVSAEFITIPVKEYAYTCFITFDSIDVACAMVEYCVVCGADAVEMMDAKALQSIDKTALPIPIHDVSLNGGALLIEFQVDTMEMAAEQEHMLRTAIESGFEYRNVLHTTDTSLRNVLWTVRKGILPRVGAARPAGTTFINEDIAFPRQQLADGIRDVQKLFLHYGYSDAVIYGHAKDGNIHFALSQRFDSQKEIERYAAFMDALAQCVVGTYNGSLKAEHGTGRNVAPFIEMEWGREAADVMRQVKQLADPQGILNPGVILNDDKHIHLKNIKPIPIVLDESDRCIECGFCEHVCPSHGLTLSPRQRIVVQREILTTDNKNIRDELQTDFEYYGIDTCAVDGMCSMVCPVGINTGTLMKQRRTDIVSPLSASIATGVARSMNMTRTLIAAASSVATKTASLVGSETVVSISSFVKSVANTPIWLPDIPRPASIQYDDVRNADVIFMPSCTTRLMGTTREGRSYQELFAVLCMRAGFSVRTPSLAASLCCGNVFSSKGYTDAHAYSSQQFVNAIESFRDAKSNSIQSFIVFDSPSCFNEVRQSIASDESKILELTQFLAEHLLPRLTINYRKKAVVLHHTCAAQKTSTTTWMEKIAQVCAESVIVPLTTACCGFAGDRGLLNPELTANATEREADDVKSFGSIDGYYSNNPPCQTAMSVSTGKRYEHILTLLEESTRMQI